jgi:glycine oxidase
MVSPSFRVLVIGDGIVGLSVALHAAARGLGVTVLAPGIPGAASPASGGMLAPSVERTQGAAQTFGAEARLAWDRVAERVVQAGGRPFSLRRNGILRVAASDHEEASLRRSIGSADRWLTPDDVRRREPALGNTRGGALYAGDGVVDAPACLTALRAVLARDRLVGFAAERASRLRPDAGAVGADTESGETFSADAAVLAAGAWSPGIAGPERLPIRPVRGTLLALGGAPLAGPVYSGSGHCYAFPRAGITLVGATSDEVGFDVSPSTGDTQRLLSAVRVLLPDAEARPRLGTLTGLRPQTPDALACIGPDPSIAGLFHASGHGRNGFLQAPLTGEILADLLVGATPRWDISPFDPARFRGK